MDINDIEIKIKKYDREKEVVIVNLIFCKTLEERGWTVRLLSKKAEPHHTFWKITPPCKKIYGNKYFWISRILDKDLWIKLQEKVIEEVKNYPDDI